MTVIGRLALGLIGMAALLVATVEPTAAARCVLAAGTQDGGSKERAIEKSRSVLEEAIQQAQQKNGWRRITSVTPMRAEPDPLFDLVRDRVEPQWLLPPPAVSRRAYTVCWSGVGSPAVCTSGAKVCGR